MLCGSEDTDATLRNLVPLSLHDYQAGDPSPQDCCKARLSSRIFRHEVQEHAHQVRGLLRCGILTHLMSATGQTRN
jgi:hypothetical protein